MPTETNREKFVRLVESRTNSVLEKIRVLGNCSNPYAYEYTEADVREIFGAIDVALRRTKAKFRDGPDRDTNEFRLTYQPGSGDQAGRSDD